MSVHDHSKLPRPGGKVVKFAQVDTLQEAFDYMYAGYHACVDKIDKTNGPEQKLWEDAAAAYLTANATMQALKALPPAAGVENARKMLANANNLADKAAAAHKSS